MITAAMVAYSNFSLIQATTSMYSKTDVELSLLETRFGQYLMKHDLSNSQQYEHW